jgi:hypothetical protein
MILIDGSGRRAEGGEEAEISEEPPVDKPVKKAKKESTQDKEKEEVAEGPSDEEVAPDDIPF